METLVEIAKVLLLLSAAAVCVYLIVVLIRFNTLLQVLQRELVDLNKNLKPVLENISAITEQVRSVTSRVDEQVQMVHGLFVAFKRVADNIVQFEERFQQRLEEPLLRVSSLFGNVLSRVISFFGRRMQGIL